MRLKEMKERIQDVVDLLLPDCPDWENNLMQAKVPTGMKIELVNSVQGKSLRQATSQVPGLTNHTTTAELFHRWQRQINSAYREIKPLPEGQDVGEIPAEWIAEDPSRLFTKLEREARRLAAKRDVQALSRLGGMIQVYGLTSRAHQIELRDNAVRYWHNHGLTNREIVEKLGLPAKLVSQILCASKVDSRLSKRNQKIMDIYLKTGSVRLAARRYGLGITTVSNIVRRQAGLGSLEEVRQKYGVVVPGGRRHFTDREIDEHLQTVERYLQKHGPQTVQHLASKFDLTYGSLRRWIKRDPNLVYQQDHYPHQLHLANEKQDV